MLHHSDQRRRAWHPRRSFRMARTHRTPTVPTVFIRAAKHRQFVDLARSPFTLLETDITRRALSPSPESRESSALVALNHSSYPNENPFSFHSRNEVARIRIVSRVGRGKKTSSRWLYAAATYIHARFVFLSIFNVQGARARVITR